MPSQRTKALALKKPLNLLSYIPRPKRLGDDLIRKYQLTGTTPPLAMVRHLSQALTRIHHAESMYHLVYIAFHFLHTLTESITNDGRMRQAKREWQAAGMGMSRRQDDLSVDQLRGAYDRLAQRAGWLEQKRNNILELMMLLVRRHATLAEANEGAANDAYERNSEECLTEDWEMGFEMVYSKLLRSMGDLDDWDDEVARISELWNVTATPEQRDEIIDRLQEEIFLTNDLVMGHEDALESPETPEKERQRLDAELHVLRQRKATLESELERLQASNDLLEMERRRLEKFVESDAPTIADEETEQRYSELQSKFKELSHTSGQFESEIITLMNEKSELEARLQDQQEQTEAKLAALASNLDLRQEDSPLDSEADETTTDTQLIRGDDYFIIQDQYEAAMAELRKTRNINQQLEEELSSAETELKSVQSESTKAGEETEELSRRAQQAVDDVTKLETEVTRLRMKLDDADSAQAKLEATAKQVIELEGDREEYELQVEKVNDEVQRITRERDKLAEQLRHAEEEKELYLKALSTDDVAARVQDKAATQNINRLKQDSMERERRIEELEKQLAEVRNHSGASGRNQPVHANTDVIKVKGKVQLLSDILREIGELRSSADNAQTDQERQEIAEQVAERLEEAMRQAGVPADSMGKGSFSFNINR